MRASWLIPVVALVPLGVPGAHSGQEESADAALPEASLTLTLLQVQRWVARIPMQLLKGRIGLSLNLVGTLISPLEILEESNRFGSSFRAGGFRCADPRPMG